MPNFLHECVARKWSTTGLSHPALFLDVPEHLLAPDPVVRMAHHCQHRERGQGVECPVILSKIGARHGRLPFNPLESGPIRALMQSFSSARRQDAPHLIAHSTPDPFTRRSRLAYG